MVCLRSSNKYIFEPFKAQVTKKDCDTIKKCYTINNYDEYSEIIKEEVYSKEEEYFSSTK